MTIHSRTRLYKDIRNAKWMGVCAGVADYFGMTTSSVRILTFLAVFFSGIWPGLVVYVILGFCLEPKPEGLYENEKEEEFWRDTRKAPDYSAADMRRRFRDIERRTNDMEAYMTSKRYRLDRELESLKD
ncbi:envelope stress response membrane protein PspC [Temperatibacter marinus]|uniref:Envelope stress response membrane protein PspC n=1 Tax=Temperatibacter marinus TaxID=1456591 RepID=A0AA52EEQ8_9PROT|nr:envelope stress response membrane protein PspC [Temperatibacter marinus]WND03360.1 envelope stress response membrane protein PspC [Temperatibacter marinus]